MIFVEKNQQAGLTILEVIIAVSVLAIVFTLISSVFMRNFNQRSFEQGVNLLNSQINKTINDVLVGNWPIVEGVKCSQNSLDQIEYTADSTIKGPGYNNECIFLGKVIQLGNEDQIDQPVTNWGIYTLIGLNSKNADYLTQFQPLYSLTAPKFDTYQENNFQHGLSLVKAYYQATEIDSFGNPVEVDYYLDGLAILQESFGQSSAGFGSGYRSISLKPVTPVNEADRKNSSRSRLTKTNLLVNQLRPI